MGEWDQYLSRDNMPPKLAAADAEEWDQMKRLNAVMGDTLSPARDSTRQEYRMDRAGAHPEKYKTAGIQTAALGPNNDVAQGKYSFGDIGRMNPAWYDIPERQRTAAMREALTEGLDASDQARKQQNPRRG